MLAVRGASIRISKEIVLNADHLVSERLTASIEATRQFASSAAFIEFVKLIETCNQALNTGRKLVFFGNGGSAAEATHIAAEFIGKCVYDVGPQSALCLNDSISAITAVANDWGFEEIFSRQVHALVREGDVLIGLSTSGSSQNVIEGLKAGRKIGAKTSLWTSSQFMSSEIDFDYVIKIPSIETPRIQEVHLQLGHILSEVIAKINLEK